jgi:hypothetical protein
LANGCQEVDSGFIGQDDKMDGGADKGKGKSSMDSIGQDENGGHFCQKEKADDGSNLGKGFWLCLKFIYGIHS